MSIYAKTVTSKNVAQNTLMKAVIHLY